MWKRTHDPVSSSLTYTSAYKVVFCLLPLLFFLCNQELLLQIYEEIFISERDEVEVASG